MTPACPCGRPLAYDACCGRVHGRLATAGSAEDVMRARYSAYVGHLEAFLLESWHPSTRPASVPFDRALRWTGLTVVDTVAGGPFDATGEVRFVATFERSGVSGTLAEHSRFERLPTGWVYADALAD